MVPAALVAYALLAWLRPLPALGVLLFLIPFGHLVRFAVAGVPFTFPEIATYLLAAAMLLQRPFVLPLKSRRFKEESRDPELASGLPLLGGGEKSTRFRDRWMVFSSLWVLVAAIAAVGSPAGVRAWGIWKAYVLAPVVLFWVTRAILRQRLALGARRQMTNDEFLISKQIPNTNNQNFLRLTSYVLLPIAASALVVAVIAILQRWWPIGVPYPWSLPGKFRATSVFGYPNAVGLYLAPLVPLLVGAAITTWVSLRAAAKQSQSLRGARLPRSPAGSLAMTIIFGGAVLVSVLAIALARSTGALVALAAVFPVFLFSTWRAGPQKGNLTHFGDRRNGWGARRGNRRAVGIVLVWVLTSLLLTVWLPYRHEQPRWGPPIVQKLTFQKWSGSVRLAQYRETWQLLRDHPIRGAGLAGYQTAIRPYHEKQDVEIFLYPHNLLLAVWVELGLAGLLVFLAILYQFFRDTLVRCQVSGVRCAITASMLVLLIHGLVDVPYFKNDLAMMFWVIVAIGVATSAGKLGDHLTAAASPPMLPSR